jgi:hypothetical protein
MPNCAHLLGAAAVAAFASCTALAGPVTLDFDDLPTGTHFQNLSTGGFRLSPSCHVDVFQAPSGSNFIGWDRSGCAAGGGNPNYVGSTPSVGFASLYIDRFDEPFEFTSITFSSDFSQSFSLISSKGGALTIPRTTGGGSLSLGGSDWKEVKWIEFTYADPGVPGVRFDSLSFNTHKVPEPSTLWLLGACGLGFAAATRRRASAAANA